MKVNTQSEKVTWPARLSLPLTEEERRRVITLKAELQIGKRSLKDFVMEAVWDKWQKENGSRK